MADQNYPVAPPNSTMALISLIASITGITIFPILGSIVGLILGFLGKKEIEESMGSLGGEGLARAGIIVGFVGLGFWLFFCCCMALIYGGSFAAIFASEMFLAVPF